MGVRGHQNAALWLPCQRALDNYIAPLREGRKGRIRVHGSVSAVSLNWLYISVGKHKKDLEGCRRHGRKMCLIFYLLLLHTCTEIRKSPAVVNWVKACFSLLEPCDCLLQHALARRTYTVSGEGYGRGNQANLSQRNCTFFRYKISYAAPDSFFLVKGALKSHVQLWDYFLWANIFDESCKVFPRRATHEVQYRVVLAVNLGRGN